MPISLTGPSFNSSLAIDKSLSPSSASSSEEKKPNISPSSRSNSPANIMLADLNNSVKKVYLIRHGQTPDNVDTGGEIRHQSGEITVSQGKKLSGQNAVPLSALGVEQAKNAGSLLQGRPSVEQIRRGAFVSSPQERTRQTTKAVLDQFGDIQKPVIFDAGLMERNAGEVTGMTWPEAGAHWPEMLKGQGASVFHEIDARYPGERGESLEMVYERASASLAKLLEGNDRVTIVSHELTIKALLAYLLDGRIDNSAFKRTVENAKPIVVQRVAGRWEIEADTGSTSPR